jgi:hypothetical protein
MSSLFTSQTPTLPDVSEGVPVTVGTTITFSTAGTVTGARVYAPATIGSGTFAAALWQITTDDSGGSGAGTLLASATFSALIPGTWNNVTFSSSVSVDTTHAYVVGLRTSEGRYAATGGLFASAIVNAPITGVQDGSAFAPAGFTKLNNGRFTSGLVNYPANTFGSNGYFIDVLFTAAGGAVTLAASGTATGGGSVALAREVQLSAPATATGGGAVSALAETTLRASGGGTAAASVTMTVPAGLSDPIAAPVAQELLACFTEKLQELPNPPKYIQMRVGQETGPLIGPNIDECCSGLAWVRVSAVYPSWDSFPGPDNTWLPCGPLAYAVVLEMGVAFCMPWSDSSGMIDEVDPPSTQDWASAFNTQMIHQTLMRQTAACCFRPTQRRAVGEWSSFAVDGGCTGGRLTVTVSVPAPCSDC